MTREPDVYRKLYQTKFRGNDTKTFQISGLPIGNMKITRKLKFHPATQLRKYHQNTYHSYCLNSLASALHCMN